MGQTTQVEVGPSDGKGTDRDSGVRWGSTSCIEAYVNVCAVVVVDPPGYEHGPVFDDVASALVGGLRRLGHTTELVHGIPTPTDDISLVLGANLLAAEPALAAGLSPNAMVYNLEQIDPGSPWCTPELIDLLRRQPVLDYSEQNRRRLAQLGVEHVALLEIGHHPVLERIEPAPTEEDIDVLFYGSLNERRAAVLTELSRRGLHVRHAFGVYGAERDALIARSRIVLNVHHFDARVFEVVRVSFLLANGRFVVSETGSDHGLEAPFRDAAAFADYHDLPDVCEAFLANPTARRAVADRGRLAMRSRPQERFLEAALSDVFAGAVS